MAGKNTRTTRGKEPSRDLSETVPETPRDAISAQLEAETQTLRNYQSLVDNLAVSRGRPAHVTRDKNNSCLVSLECDSGAYPPERPAAFQPPRTTRVAPAQTPRPLPSGDSLI
ncbi:hypothetical protein K491DRAFT_685813 [Lophiostoma macrostomum CBS 122681]|uniref:Uncharacterized protein n=1 Tax=Lophiostoma macrostomum CBS 122681 TaxID=1314788 RepID=A0A6A6SH31_9PLEO|nr:hypothetical protein K491DRAFT_685813 [Lophiostoma macrostomum CBS 122681]